MQLSLTQTPDLGSKSIPRSFVLILVLISLLSCHKSPIEEKGIVGQWVVDSVFKCSRSSPFFLYPFENFIPVHEQTGTIEFRADSTGTLHLSDKITYGYRDFKWQFFSNSDTIIVDYLDYPAETFVFYIDLFTLENLNIYIIDFKGTQGVGAPVPYFFLKTSKQTTWIKTGLFKW